MDVALLLRIHARRGGDRTLHLASHSLEKMARGGMYDQLGGGFHRYSVDRFWHIPHFEKMLYDNGQLASVFAQAYGLTKRDDFRRVLSEMVDFCPTRVERAGRRVLQCVGRGFRRGRGQVLPLGGG